MEFKPADYLELPVDLRLHFLGLPVGRRRGRPKDLTFRERVRVAQAHAEALNAHAIHVRDRWRDRAIAKLQAKFRELCKAQAVPHKIREVQAAIDKVGRVTRVPIKPPNKLLPEIDMQVAKLFGITDGSEAAAVHATPSVARAGLGEVGTAGLRGSAGGQAADDAGAPRQAGAAHAGQWRRQGWPCRRGDHPKTRPASPRWV